MAAPSFRDPRSERIYRRLLQIGEGPAAFFADAYRLMEDNLPLETRSHMVGHALRELESGVRAVLAAATRAPSGQHDDGTKITAPDVILHVVTELGLQADGAVAQGWVALASTLHGIAHRRNLGPPRPPDDRLDETWLTMLAVLDGLLDRFESRYADVFARLDRLAEVRSPTGADLDEFAKTIPHTEATLHYFFERLTSPEWFHGLRKRGVFGDPPASDVDPAEETVRFPGWPAAVYLKRVAGAFPEEVGKIIGSLVTENLRVQEQAVEVALVLPMEHLVPIVPVIRRWIPGMLRFRFFGESVIVVGEKLAAAGQREAACEIVRALLTPQERDDVARSERASWARHEQVPYYLQHRATSLLDAVARCAGIRIVELLGEPLEQRLRSLADDEVGDAAEASASLGARDHSSIWLPHLKSEAPHRIGAMPGFLSFHLRRVLDEIVRHGVQFEDIVAALRQRGTLLFRRIELDFLASHPRAAPELARVAMLDRRFFGEVEVRAEYATLLASAFDLLDTAGQDLILGWITAGPDYSWEADEELRRGWRERSERDWLAALEQHLDGVRQGRLRQLIAEYGEPRAIRNNESGVSFWTGPTSPMEQTEIAGMSIDQIVEFLKSWTADESPMSASPEGLARSLDAAVAADPAGFAQRADAFEALDPTYVRALLNGLEDALREDRTFEWGAVLTLGTWLVEQPVGLDHSEDRGSPDRDNGFRPARRALMSLLQRALIRSDSGTLPFDERGRIWSLISRVAEDENPSPQYEEQWGGDNMNPATLALNTVRPYAIRTAIKYALWINYHTNAQDEPIGMDSVSELRELLERSFDPAQDPSSAVRAAVGYELGHLVWLDSAWVRANRGKLFPADRSLLPLRLALFDTFLMYGWLQPAVVGIIPEEYEAAIQRAGVDRGTRHFGDKPDQCLADHLMNLYLGGHVPLQGEPGLIDSFFRDAPDDVRTRAMHFVGWSLFRAEGAADAAVLERLCQLWEWRAPALHQEVTSGGNRAALRELSEFGWWFASRAFDPDWALPHLQAVLRHRGVIEWDHEVTEYLADLVDERPRDVINTLALFDPTAGGDIWNVRHWLEHARAIFRRCLADDDPAVRESALALVNRWIARGHLDLRDLLARGDGGH